MSSDPFQMVVIHRAFRAEFGEFPCVIRAIEPHETSRIKFVGKYLGNMIAVLHHHHAAEDELLWPKLRERKPNCDKGVDRAEHAHAEIAKLVDQVEHILPSWMHAATPRLTEQLGDVTDELYSRLDHHLDDEEQNVLELIEQHITAEEWKAFIDRGGAYVGPRNLWFALAFGGVILRNATDDEQRRFLASLPTALRMVLRALGDRACASHRRQLHGAERA